ASSTARDLANDNPGPAADFEHDLARLYPNQVQNIAHQSQIIRAAPPLEDADDAEERPTQTYGAVARTERWNEGLPLRGGQRERHQDQRRAGATNAVGDPCRLAFSLRQPHRRGRVAIEKV